MDTFKRQ